MQTAAAALLQLWYILHIDAARHVLLDKASENTLECPAHGAQHNMITAHSRGFAAVSKSVLEKQLKTLGAFVVAPLSQLYILEGMVQIGVIDFRVKSCHLVKLI